MNKNLQGGIVVGLALGALGLAYYFLVYKKDKGDAYQGFGNMDSLKANIGAAATISKDGVISVKFNEGKNFAQFYSNDRFIIFNSKDNSILVKGKYLNGGQDMYLDNGKEISGGSIWGNLLQTIKK